MKKTKERKSCSTKAGFLEALAGTKPFMEWRKTRYGTIRAKRLAKVPNQRAEYCPITAIASVQQVGEFTIGKADDPEARGPLGISKGRATEIITADFKSDSIYIPGAKKIRKDMLEALGLQPDKPEPE